MEKLLKETIDQNTNLAKAIDSINTRIDSKSGEGNSTLNSSQIDQIASKIVNHNKIQELTTNMSSLRSDVAKSETVVAVRDQLNSLGGVINDINTTTQTMKTNIEQCSKVMDDMNRDSKNEMKQIRENSDNSLVIFKSMNESLGSLVSSAGQNQNKTSSTSSQVWHLSNRQTRLKEVSCSRLL